MIDLSCRLQNRDLYKNYINVADNDDDDGDYYYAYRYHYF